MVENVKSSNFCTHIHTLAPSIEHQTAKSSSIQFLYSTHILFFGKKKKQVKNISSWKRVCVCVHPWRGKCSSSERRPCPPSQWWWWREKIRECYSHRLYLHSCSSITCINTVKYNKNGVKTALERFCPDHISVRRNVSLSRARPNGSL